MAGVRARLEGIGQVEDGLEKIEAFARDFEQVAGDLWQEAFDAVQVPFLNELQAYPPPKRNSRYIRTMRLKHGWTLRFVRSGLVSQIVVSNNVEYVKWVVGSFDQRRDYQTQMHKTTGWFPARDTKNYWFGVAQEEFQQRYDKYLSGYGVFRVSSRNR